jgi:hypothetical protein
MMQIIPEAKKKIIDSQVEMAGEQKQTLRP